MNERIYHGKIYSINETKQVTGTFKERKFVVKDFGNERTNFVEFQVVQSKCEMLDSFKVGDKVEVYYNLQGRAVFNKETGEEFFFNSIVAYKIEK